MDTRTGRAGKEKSGSGAILARMELLRILDEGFRDAARRAGSHLVCRPGCDACCREPFPITRLDRELLQEGLRELERADPDRARAVRRRAAEAREALRTGFPGDAATGRLRDDEAALDRFFAAHRGRACPALDPATGRCDLYDGRPVACRTYGPPLRFGDRTAPHCDLGFRDATPAEIERARWEPDPRGVEREALAARGAAPDEAWETLVAWAL